MGANNFKYYFVIFKKNGLENIVKTLAKLLKGGSKNLNFVIPAKAGIQY